MGVVVEVSDGEGCCYYWSAFEGNRGCAMKKTKIKTKLAAL